MQIGVLALQGDFAKHAQALHSLGVAVQEVRKGRDLDVCDGLIIPGGESTTMLRQIAFAGLRESLLAFAEECPIFGTCAGLILMSQTVRSSHLQPLRLLDIEVERNAFGRQVDSFQTPIFLELSPGCLEEFPAFFIRAPRIRICEEGVQVLARWKEEPVLVQQGRHLGATFHPELTSNLLVHQYFIDMI